VSQIIKKFIGDNQVADEKIRLDNASYLRSRNAADSGDINVIGVDANNITVVDSLFYKFGQIISSLYWGSSGVGFRAKQTTTYDHFDLMTEDHASNSTDPGISLIVATGDKPGGSSTGDCGALWLHTGSNAGSGGSGYLSIDTGDTSGAGDSGSMDIFTGGGNGAGGSGYLALTTGNSAGSAGATGDIPIKTGNCTATTGASGKLSLTTGNSTNGNSGNIEMLIGTAGGTQGSFKFLKSGVASVSGQVWTASGTDGTGYWATPASGESRAKQTFVLNGTDITNQYVTLSNSPLSNSVHVQVKGAGAILEGASYDYSLSGAQLNFLNDLATGGASALVAGDVLQVTYEY
jgi:hypothetical protein